MRKGESFATTNMISLSEFLGWRYDRLVYHFSRRRKFIYIDDDVIIIRSERFDRGRQGDKLVRRGSDGRFIKK